MAWERGVTGTTTKSSTTTTPVAPKTTTTTTTKRTTSYPAQLQHQLEQEIIKTSPTPTPTPAPVPTTPTSPASPTIQQILQSLNQLPIYNLVVKSDPSLVPKTTTIPSPTGGGSTGGYIPITIKENLAPTPTPAPNVQILLPPKSSIAYPNNIVKPVSIQQQNTQLLAVRKQIISQIHHGVNPAMAIRNALRYRPVNAPRTRKHKPFIKSYETTQDNIWQFRYDNPDVEIPRSEYGDYDVVKTKIKTVPGWKQYPTTRLMGLNGPGATIEYEFSYSTKAKHKIRTARSLQKYVYFK